MNKKQIKAWLPLLAVITGLVLRLVTLERRSLWLDETETLRIAALEAGDIIAGQADQNPPLYHLLMHYWIGEEQSEFALRLPSALAGVAAIPLLYWLVREWHNQWSAMASAWLLAIAPLHLWYSQEARAYALVCTLGLASTLFYTLAIRRGKPLIWLAWIAATVAGLYTHYSMLLLVLVQLGLLAPLRKANNSRRSVLWSALAAFLIVSLLFAPQASTFVAQFMQSGWGGGYYYLSVQSLLSEWGISISPTQLYAAVALAAVFMLGIATFSIKALLGGLRQTRAGTVLVIASTALYLLILIASAVPRALGVKRQVLILLPYAAGVVSVLTSIPAYRARLLTVLILVTLPVMDHVIVAREQEAWRDVAYHIEENAEPQDIVLFNAPYMQQPFDHYYRGDAPRQGIRVRDIPEVLPNITASHQRAWLVLSQDELSDPGGKVQRWFDDNYPLLDEYTFTGVRVRLYDIGKPPD